MFEEQGDLIANFFSNYNFNAAATRNNNNKNNNTDDNNNSNNNKKTNKLEQEMDLVKKAHLIMKPFVLRRLKIQILLLLYTLGAMVMN